MSLLGRPGEIAAALRHIPDLAGWRRAGVEFLWALPLMLLVAHLGDLVRFDPVADASTLAALAATLFFAPAFGEELLFRGLIIPLEGAASSSLAVSVLLFVLWHPLQALTFGPPWAEAFLDPWFLAAVAILGTALARIYVATASLWPCILVHWLVVLGWKALFGGPF